MVDPLDCPFCGSSEIKLQQDRLFNTPHYRYYCNDCGGRQNFSCNGMDEVARSMALDVWNKRA